MLLRHLLVGLFLVMPGLVHAEMGGEAWRFLMPGTYHADEAPGDPGTGWFALAVMDGHWQLAPVDVRAVRVHDPMLDAEGVRTGIRIEAPEPGALALLRGLGLRGGKVDTPDMRFAGSPRSLSPRQALEIPFRGQHYRIMVSGGTLHLTLGAQRARLPGLRVGDGEDAEAPDSASLLWAGDLDRDGGLDLLIGYRGYTRSGACLFLSSQRGSGRLLGHVACHGGIGR